MTAGGGGSATAGSPSTGGGAGSGGAVVVSPCDGVAGGIEHGGHCYVDLTMSSAGHETARSDCTSFGDFLGRSAYLVSLGSAEEESFVKSTFLGAGTRDAFEVWLGFQCHEADVSSCGCFGGCLTGLQRDLATTHWSWDDMTAVSYVNWGGSDPDATGRCSTLAYFGAAYSWRDRECTKLQYSDGGVTHYFRTVCELD
jgi:hypothetical protein